MFDFSKKNENQLTSLTKVIGLLVLLSMLILGGCASQISVESQEVRIECAPKNKVYTEMDIKKQQLTEECALKGIVELVEEFNIETDTRVLFNQAVVLLKNDEYQEAIDVLKQVVRKEQKFTAPYLNLGIAYFRMEEWKKAERNFLKALKLNAVHPVANNELGMLYRKTGRYVEARERYELLLNDFPGFMPARRNLGMLCDIYLQDLQCAKQQYEIYLEDDPGNEQVKIWMLDLKSRL